MNTHDTELKDKHHVSVAIIFIRTSNTFHTFTAEESSRMLLTFCELIRPSPLILEFRRQTVKTLALKMVTITIPSSFYCMFYFLTLFFKS